MLAASFSILRSVRQEWQTIKPLVPEPAVA
jgi:hypothetical protein